jgi:hypothetical protein
MKAQRGSLRYNSTLSLILALDWGRLLGRGPCPRQGLGALCVGGWVGPVIILLDHIKTRNQFITRDLAWLGSGRSTVHSPFWEANRSSTRQEIPSVFWKPKVHYRIQNRPPAVPILSQIETYFNLRFSVITSKCCHHSADSGDREKDANCRAGVLYISITETVNTVQLNYGVQLQLVRWNAHVLINRVNW